jgi:hypothetical protein
VPKREPVGLTPDQRALGTKHDWIPMERVSILLGHQSVRVTEKYYAAWTDSRQRQVEADLQRAWEQDPIVMLEAKVTRRLRENIEAVN